MQLQSNLLPYIDNDVQCHITWNDMNHISKFIFPELSLSQLADIKIRLRSLRTHGDTHKSRKEKTKLEDVIKKNHPAAHDNDGCILFLMRLTFTSVMEPVVSLQTLKAERELATKSVARLKSMALSHQVKHLL